MNYITPSRKYTRRIEALARDDANGDLPDIFDSHLSPGEQLLIHEVQQDLDAIRGTYRMHDAPLHARFTEARRDYADVARRYRKKLVAGAYRPDLTGSKWALGAVAAGIMIAEVPINFQVFDVFLREAVWLNAILCLVVSALLALAAEMIGKSFRQNGNRPTKMSGLFIVIVVTLIAVIAYLRSRYAAALPPVEGMEQFKVEDPVVIAVLFVFLNGLFLVVAAASAWNHFDTDAEYHELAKRYKRTRAAAYRLRAQRDRLAADWHARIMRRVRFSRAIVETYRAANLAGRLKKAIPQAWLERPSETLFPDDAYALSPPNDNEIPEWQDEPVPA